MQELDKKNQTKNDALSQMRNILLLKNKTANNLIYTHNWFLVLE